MSGKCKIYWGLWPFSVLYGIGVRVRNLLFDVGWLHEERFPLPVICIGNLTVGGTGKTPHTEYLIRLLQNLFRLAVLSRGYKRKSKGFVLASSTSQMEDIGDEPYPPAYLSARSTRYGSHPAGRCLSTPLCTTGTAHSADGLPSPCRMRPASSCRTPSGTSQWKEKGRFAHRHEMSAYPQPGGMRTYPTTHTATSASGSVFHYPGLRKAVSPIYGYSCPTAGCVKR